MYISADMMQRPRQVAVVIPAYNEADRIESTVRAVRSLPRVHTVVVVDDGSQDDTSALAKGAGAIVVRHKRNRGKAAAMMTGAKVIALREVVAVADGGSLEAYDTGRVEQHLQPSDEDGPQAQHTGPLPLVPAKPASALALLFVDADLQDSASETIPLLDAVLDQHVDMAISLLPEQERAGGGFGLAVKTARAGIERATGYVPLQPLSGTRCLTREVWEACQPLASGWGVETGLTIDALRQGFAVKEVECSLFHRVTGRDMTSQLHRAGQLKDIVLALSTRVPMSKRARSAKKRRDS